ncbi:MAG: putative O-glycosylation ligase, exosortase A system-associated [Alphaproteobacteria bacterium]|nr:putative O-glycosylation ligase, exosortase A system-associated [Alphaproteobacteria bacterium]
MRSLFVLALVFSWLPAIAMWPYLGVLAWMWISYMNPHRLTDGLAYDFPVAEVIAIATLLAWVFSRERKDLPMRPVVILIILYTLYTTLTSVTALNQPLAWEKWQLFVKVILFTLIAIPLMNSKVRLHAMIWVMVISCGYFAARGGLFTAITMGAYRVFGPPGTFHGDNNGIGVTFLMILPLIRYLQLQTDNRFAWLFLLAAQVLTLLAIFGTQSRGAVVGLTAMAFYMLARSRRIGTMITIGLVAVLAYQFMPASMKQRQESTFDYQSDASAQGRLTMWKFAIDVANERPIIGGGFNVFYDNPTRDRLLPRNDKGQVEQGRAAHSIYFEVLGEHGYVGLLLYLMTGIWGFFSAERTAQRAKRRPDTKWAADLGRAVQLGLIGFAVGGAFLSKATFDLYYHLLAVVVIADLLVTKALKEPAPEVVPPGDPILAYFFKPRAQSFRPGPATGGRDFRRKA